MATTAEQKKDMPVPQSGHPPYPFRTAIGIILLLGNILVALIYFHILDI